jgi:transposase
MEATGGYEKRAFALLWARGVPVAVVNPCAVRRFAEGMGVLEKTDAIDAGVIAWYAEVKQVRPTPLPSPEQMRLQALVTRLRQLTDLQTQQRQQARLVSDEVVLAGYTELLALVAKQIRTLEEAIAERIAADPLWQQLDAAFRTIKGVADRTVARVMAHMPEIGTLSNKAVAKLAGLAPLAKDSGKRHGPRAVRGGRREVRDILYFVAGVVRKYEPDFATFHDRLRQAGKAKKVIRVALAHKLLVRLNAKAREVRRAFPPLSCAVPM